MKQKPQPTTTTTAITIKAKPLSRLRGRPLIRPENLRGETVSVRFTAAELAAIDEASGRENIARSRWIVEVAMAAAKAAGGCQS